MNVTLLLAFHYYFGLFITYVFISLIENLRNKFKRVSKMVSKMKKLFVMILIFIMLTGCNSNESTGEKGEFIGNPTAENVLEGNPEANIFMYSDIIYSAGVSWVDEMNLTKDKQITEIAQQKSNGEYFENGTANKLTVGTKIFSVKERSDILIAETKEGDIKYFKLVEG